MVLRSSNDSEIVTNGSTESQFNNAFFTPVLVARNRGLATKSTGFLICKNPEGVIKQHDILG